MGRTRREGVDSDGNDPERTFVASFDHLIGSGDQRWRHGEAEHAGGLVVDDQLELRRLHDWQFRRLGALEDAASIDADLTIRVRDVASVTH